MSKFKLIGATVFLLLMGCAEQKSRGLYSYNIKPELDDSTLVYPQLYEIEELFSPANFSLQSNNGGLVITPLTPALGYSLFFYEHEEMTTCCSQMNGLLKRGRGPGESGLISAGARTPDGDTLVYYSTNTSRFYHFDQHLNLAKNPFVHPGNVIVTSNFAYADGKYYSEDTFSADEKILRIYNSKTNTTKTLIDYRIPRGYQPAARNDIASIVSTPDHVLVALNGDKEVLVLNKEDRLVGKIVLGQNDPLPEPYQPASSGDVESSLQHIFKMEYHEDMIFILMYSGLIVLNSEFEFINRLVFVNENDEKIDISDFTVNSDKVYLRQGLSSLYRADYSEIKRVLY